MDEPAAARAVSTDARGSAFGSPGLADPTAWMAPPDLRPAGGAEAQGAAQRLEADALAGLPFLADGEPHPFELGGHPLVRHHDVVEGVSDLAFDAG